MLRAAPETGPVITVLLDETPRMKPVADLNSKQRGLVIDTTRDYIQRAESIFRRSFEIIPITFDLKGRSAGMYRIRSNHAQIRYNPFIFAKYFDDNLKTTVPHEVAHYITDWIFGLRNIRPHGREWKAVMESFGAEPSRTCNYDLSGMPVRRSRRHAYTCGCSTHALSSIRHNRIERGAARYFCKNCQRELVRIR